MVLGLGFCVLVCWFALAGLFMVWAGGIPEGITIHPKLSAEVPKMLPKGTKMEPLGIPWGPFWGPWAPLGAPWAPLGAPLGSLGAQGVFLHQFWSIFGSILGAQMPPKSY